MALLENINNDLIKRYCGQDASFRLQGAVTNLFDSTIKIVNTGMVSSGKSSLYNVLTGNTEKERFPTGSARTTTFADPYRYKNMVFVDTPGIDVRDLDDEIAFRTIMESDIILMVHNIKTGPLTRAESEWLSRIASGMANFEMCRQRMIFVCTWKDTRENEDGYYDILNEVKRMVYDAVGTEIPFFDVSVRKYLTGVEKGKPILCEKSGINDLGTFIEDFSAEYAVIKQHYAKENFQRIAEEIITILNVTKNQKRAEVEKKRRDIDRRFHSKRSGWKAVFDYFGKRREALAELKRELKEI